MSLSNLPPGCLDSHIPGNRPLDIALDKLSEEKACIACLFYNLCSQAHDRTDCKYFKPTDDLVALADRLESEDYYRKD